ncbi:MAG: GNAT family N-acetyltransferase [Bacteroidota bacterium]|nr:GNAT family N-acetyltransferase [Bacteroidota bacterium]
MLKTVEISLRSLENKDLDFLLALENDTSIWGVSGTTTPFTEVQIENYIQHAKQDIGIAEQYRYVIDLQGSPIGCVDLYNYNWQKKRAGVGIVITETYRRKGYAKQALLQLINYAWNHLHLEQLHSKISPENKGSIALFSKVGFLQKGNTLFVLNR